MDVGANFNISPELDPHDIKDIINQKSKIILILVFRYPHLGSGWTSRFLLGSHFFDKVLFSVSHCALNLAAHSASCCFTLRLSTCPSLGTA